VDTPLQELGVLGTIAMTVLLTASLVAAGVIWLVTTHPESLVMLATADNIWGFMAGLATRLLAII